MQTITEQGLVAMLAAKVGAFIVTLVTDTVPNLTKKDRVTGAPLPYKGVHKVSRVNGILNWGYEDAVNRQLVREGGEPDFTAHPRQWGVRLPKSPFVSHKDKLYVELKVERTLGHEYMDQDGRVIPDEALVNYLPKVDLVGRQGVDKPIIPRDYEIKNIIAIRMDGEDYVIVRRP